MLLIDSNRSGDVVITEFSSKDLETHVSNSSDGSTSGAFVLFVDVETTGLSYENDRIIQLACRPAIVDRKTGNIVKLVAGCKTFFNDPGVEISDEISALTGVTNKDVKGNSVNWNWFAGILNKVDFVVSHNVRFDRHFIKKHMIEAGIEMPERIWACSMSQVDWRSVCTAGRSLETLCAWHGFYYKPHDAGNDVNAMIYLLAKSGFMCSLLENAEKSQYRVFAVDFPRAKNDELKARKYRWDPDVRMWWLGFDDEEKANSEINWLKQAGSSEPQVFEVKAEHLFD